MSAPEFVDGRSEAFPSRRRPAVHRSLPDPRRSRDDHDPVPYQVALGVQELLDLVLGEEPFDIVEAAPVMARLAGFTVDGHHAARVVWTRAGVLARVAELVHEYRVSPELGGDVLPVSGAGELAAAR